MLIKMHRLYDKGPMHPAADPTLDLLLILVSIGILRKNERLAMLPTAGYGIYHFCDQLGAPFLYI